MISYKNAFHSDLIGWVNYMQDQFSRTQLLLGKSGMERLLAAHPQIQACFNVRVDIESLDNEALVSYAREYALEQEYSIDNLGVLALHTRIAENQRHDHAVTVAQVREFVDNAIGRAKRPSLRHFFDVLFGKRYDEEDMIILREKDFIYA